MCRFFSRCFRFALSPAWHSLVSLAHCIPYDSFSLLFPRPGLCFLFRCIPHGQQMLLWQWTQGQAQATVENESTLLPQVSYAFFSHSMCGLSASCFPAGLLPLSFCLAGDVGKNNVTEQSEGSKTLAGSALAFRLSSALLQSLQGLSLKWVSQDCSLLLVGQKQACWHHLTIFWKLPNERPAQDHRQITLQRWRSCASKSLWLTVLIMCENGQWAHSFSGSGLCCVVLSSHSDTDY